MSLGHSSFNFKKPHELLNLRKKIFRMPVVPCLYDDSVRNDSASKTTLFSLKIGFFFCNDKHCAKLLICIENAKSKKPRTWPSSKIVSDEGHVLQNAKICNFKEIKSLAHQETFFVYSKMTALSTHYTQFLVIYW